MQLFIFSVICLIAHVLSQATQVGYINYYDGAGCVGNAVARAPRFEGNVTYCWDDTQATCIGKLGGLSKPGLTTCRTNKFMSNNASTFVEIENGVSEVLAFDQCYTSSVYAGCTFKVTVNPPVDDPTKAVQPTQAIVGYLNYYLENAPCNTAPVFRAPIFPGNNDFCPMDPNTNCLTSLNGFSLPHSTLPCKVNQLSKVDTCTFSETENGTQAISTYGTCGTTSIFNRCRFNYVPTNGGIFDASACNGASTGSTGSVSTGSATTGSVSTGSATSGGSPTGGPNPAPASKGLSTVEIVMIVICVILAIILIVFVALIVLKCCAQKQTVAY